MSNLSTVSSTTKRTLSSTAKRNIRIAGMLEASIQGIPCLIDVITCNVTKGNYSRMAETPDEYYGSTDIEFDVYDRKGYAANWLEKKMTEDDVSNIEETILAANNDDGDYGYDD
jgi:hypothetical protein